MANKLHLLEASAFVKAPPELREQLRRSNLLPVNDVFLPTWDKDSQVMAFYGSYGSGKSVYVVDRLIQKARYQKYFRCFFGRKVLDSVRPSIFQTLVDEIEAQYLDHEFNYSKQPNGSMVITHRETGNTFTPFGANNADSMKSIKDPTDIVMEEADQFDFTDFGLLFSRLRTEKANTQLWLMFNTEKVYASHWLRAKLLEPKTGDSDSELYKGVIFSLVTTYRHNFFIDQEAYEKRLRITAAGDMALYNAIANAAWGNVRTGLEVWKSFSESRHIKRLTAAASPIHLSLDENVNPYVTVSAWQADVAARKLRQVHELPCESPDNNAPRAALKTVRWLQQIGHTDTVFVYGDPSGSKRSTVDPNSASFFDKFIEVLRANGFTVISRVQRSAPQVALSVAFVNEIFAQGYNGWEIEIHSDCFKSIEDYLLTKEDKDGTILKLKVTDKESKVRYEPYGHFSDAMRYFIAAILAAEFAAYKVRASRRPPVIEVPAA